MWGWIRRLLCVGTHDLSPEIRSEKKYIGFRTRYGYQKIINRRHYRYCTRCGAKFYED